MAAKTGFLPNKEDRRLPQCCGHVEASDWTCSPHQDIPYCSEIVWAGTQLISQDTGQGLYIVHKTSEAFKTHSCRFGKRKHNINFCGNVRRTLYQYMHYSGFPLNLRGTDQPLQTILPPTESLQFWDVRCVPTLTSHWWQDKCQTKNFLKHCGSQYQEMPRLWLNFQTYHWPLSYNHCISHIFLQESWLIWHIEEAWNTITNSSIFKHFNYTIF